MLLLYRCLTNFLFPLFVIFTYLRVIFKKEDKFRFKEKIFPSEFRANRNSINKLFWFHAASIGEVLSILPLIEKINLKNKNIDFLITTVTLSSANLLERKLKKYNNINHRFFPLDVNHLSEHFLNVWKPDLICFVDSEIWPNILFKIKEKNITLVLLNGRITKKTLKKWKNFPNFAKKVFNNFDLCLASSNESQNNLSQLQVRNLNYVGNLKFSVKNKMETLDVVNKKILNNFKVWCAVSTHEGEELFALKTHLEIKKEYNKILTIIIPRHISRVSDIKKLSDKYNLQSQILNNEDKLNSNTEIVIVNSFGAVSKYFSYCKNIFVGKSLIKKLELVGGQNPIEAAKVGCQIFHGPYIYNFKEVYELLKNYNISEVVNDEKDMSARIIKNFKNPKDKNQEQINLLDTYGEKILEDTINELSKLSQL